MKTSFYQKELSDSPKPNGNEPTCLHTIISRECRVTQMPIFQFFVFFLTGALLKPPFSNLNKKI